MKILCKWVSGFFEDQKGKQSSKRVGLYWAFALLSYMVVKGVSDMEMFWGVLGIILVFGGYSTAEFFKSLPKNNDNEK